MSTLAPAPRRERPARRAPRTAAPAPVVAPARGGLRLAAWTLLALLAAHAWADQVAPASRAAATASVLLGSAIGALLLLAPRVTSRRRRLLLVDGLALGALVLALATCGVPLRLLLPDAWGELAAGIGQGLGALPGVRVPYRGLDEWTRATIVLGGTLLVLVSAWVAFVPRGAATGRPLVAAGLLATLYAVPVVERAPDHPFLQGTAVTVLLAVLLWGDRLPRGQARPAAILLAVAAVAAAVLAPRLDGDRPLFDYESFVADSLQGRNTSTFSWQHRYGPLNWTRTGREVLRIRARQGTYWKAAVLPEFDGRAWRTTDAVDIRTPDTEIAEDPGYRQQLTVVVAGLRSPEYVTAGSTRSIAASPRLAIESGFGTFRTGSRPLRRGDAYRAEVYVPQPSPETMRDAGSSYPLFTRRFLSMGLPDSERSVLLFPRWGESQSIFRYALGAPPRSDGEEQLLASPYRRTYRLAQRLRAASATPYDFIRNVRARVMRDATYTETPRVDPRAPLDGFLFDRREGYCQQFSGAMALLLRMGGVPARVASGFTAGTYDDARKEWVVRDLDAHSWVEAYVPGQGWVAFDPTPAAAPPRSQLRDDDEPATTPDEPAEEQDADEGPAGAPADARLGGGPGAPAASPGDESLSLGPPLLVVLAAGVLVAFVVRRRVGVRADDPPELAELLQALRLTGRPPATGTTLRQLEERFRHAPQAADYLRAVRAQRYAPSATGPGRAQRAALRTALADGLGAGGRLRAWWALPPRPVGRRGRRA
ncbi:hypothetical protein GKE82_02220 [Conexibacter sp. W3-3-2]|uniref:transglutaminase family protein n=1 Tax=Conexibacter sp. W3-3-2 TaxID=2675227 RepID=UPI0012B85417|nr:transglutaminase domain-containing protein [Conexibacter sp. W3-3-2]MTD43149.1 hypothetical protein [Conexibacter sp. W3-3-2]